MGKAIRGMGLIAHAYRAVGRMERAKTDEERFAIADEVYKRTRDLLGIKVEFNGVPFVKDRPVLYVGGHHISRNDFLVALSGFRASFMMLKRFFDAPFVGPFSRAVHNIPAAQLQKIDTAGLSPEEEAAKLKQEKERVKEWEQASFIENYQAGYNSALFASGTTTDGSKIVDLSPGVLEILFGKTATKDGKTFQLKENEIPLVQLFTVEVKSIDGRPARKGVGRDTYPYAWQYSDGNMVRGIWRMLQAESMVINLKAFEPIDPRTLPDTGSPRENAKALTETLYQMAKNEVVPHQTERLHRNEHNRRCEAITARINRMRSYKRAKASELVNLPMPV